MLSVADSNLKSWINYKVFLRRNILNLQYLIEYNYQNKTKELHVNRLCVSLAAHDEGKRSLEATLKAPHPIRETFM